MLLTFNQDIPCWLALAVFVLIAAFTLHGIAAQISETRLRRKVRQLEKELAANDQESGADA